MSALGIYDSGLGGIHVYQEIRRIFPDLAIKFFADTVQFPLSNKSNDEIKERLKKVTDFLFEDEDCAIVILACNTASVAAIRSIQEGLIAEKRIGRQNILGINIAAIEYANELYAQYKDMKGLVMSTPTTHRSGFYQERLREVGFTNVSSIGLPDLAVAIEDQDEEHIIKAVREPMESAGINPEEIAYVVLGCTHYPIVAETLKNELFQSAEFIDPAEAVGKKLQEYLEHHNEYRLGAGESTFYVSGNAQDFSSKVKKVLGLEISFVQKTV
jgi:glutamate racemase